MVHRRRCTKCWAPRCRRYTCAAATWPSLCPSGKTRARYFPVVGACPCTWDGEVFYIGLANYRKPSYTCFVASTEPSPANLTHRQQMAANALYRQLLGLYASGVRKSEVVLHAEDNIRVSPIGRGVDITLPANVFVPSV